MLKVELNMDFEKETVLVGERTSITGSAEFRNLILEERFDDAVELGKRQIEDGAGILDICFISSRDEKGDMGKFLIRAVKKIEAPLMIDSLSDEVIEEALKTADRNSIINSINLAQGEGRLERVAKLALTYGAAVVVGAIDRPSRGGMAIERGKKLDILTRSVELLTGKYRMEPSDIIVDPLLFPVSSKFEGCKNPVKETVASLGLIKRDLPRVKTLIGLSNISFGLPDPARITLNSVFLHHSKKAGVDLAIADPGRLRPLEEINPALRHLAEELIFSGGEAPLEKFLNFFQRS